MARTLLLCFIHGFKGDDDTFRNFPADLKRLVSGKLPDHNVESVVYPKYETKGELAQCSQAFLDWLKEQVMGIRKATSAQAWPPHDRDVGVVLVAHSMGGFVASDTLCLILNERLANNNNNNNSEEAPMFPLIQGVLTFDTPFNGLARSMFVYGAFSNYQKVSSVFNVMTALSAAPSALGKSAMLGSASSSAAAAAVPASRRSTSTTWRGWQLLAVRTGTVGAIAAGGVTAYIHRQKILDGVRSMRNLNRESMKEGVKEGYQQGVDTLSQGLAYVNRGSVGQSFEYLSDHFTFIGSLMKQQELSRRLERMASLGGVGIHDFYTSLGENGVWSGGYFVPERTFCAVPVRDDPASALFSRQVIRNVDDEIQAHVSMFAPEKNKGYEQMADRASDLVVRWFASDAPLFDDPKFAAPVPPEPVEEPVETTASGSEVPRTEGMDPEEGDAEPKGSGGRDFDGQLPDESPMDIAAAASLVPLPDDEAEDPEGGGGGGVPKASQETYLRYLMGVASQAGTGVTSYVPRSMPEMPSMPSMPSGPSFKSFIPTQIPSIPRPSSGLFRGKNKPADQGNDGSGTEKVDSEGQEARNVPDTPVTTATDAPTTTTTST